MIATMAVAASALDTLPYQPCELPSMNVKESSSVSPSPRVSIITIFLDGERFIQEAIDSVLGQTFPDWELILVDDGSTDASRTIALEAARERPDRIRYVEHPDHRNLGMSASRNLGLREARGDYVAFLDCDDVYLPQRLARHVEVLDAMPQVAMVQSNHIQWYSWARDSEQADDDFVRPTVSLGDRILVPPQALLIALAVPWLLAAPASLTVRRSVALDVGGFEDSFRNMYEDQVFTTKIYLEHRVYVLQDWLVKYRRHPESWTRRLKETGEFVDGLPHPTTDAFHAWLSAYVRSHDTQHPLLSELVEARTTHTTTGRLGRARLLLTRLAGRTKVLMERIVPHGLLRRLRRWDRRRRHARLRRAYATLCDRVHEAKSPTPDTLK